MGNSMRMLERWSAVLFFILAFVCVLVLHGAVPFVALPTLPQALLTTGFSLSFLNESLSTLYAGNFGLPEPAAISFGLAGAYPAGLFIAAGLHPADAYAAMAALWLALAFGGAWRVGLMFGLKSRLSTLAAVLWLTMPIVWAHAIFSMLSFGIALLPSYFWATFRLFKSNISTGTTVILSVVLYIAACLIAVFMDGYSFMMFAVGASFLLGYSYWRFPNQRGYLIRIALPVHVFGFGLAYFLYATYIGKSQFEPDPLSFFRGWGLDLAFLVIPSQDVHWLWDILGLSVHRSEDLFFGDGSVWITTFSLPLIIAGCLSWWVVRKKQPLAHGLLLVALFGFYMAMGPSLKINSVKPEPMGPLMSAELAIVSTGNVFLSQHLPGFKNMRAAYRWSALGFFGMWVLLLLLLAQGKGKRAELLGTVILVALIVSFLPHLERKWQANVRDRESFLEIDRDLVSELARDLNPGEMISFLPFRNDFLVNYLASALSIRTYNIGGDKSLMEARKHWPDIMQQFKMGQIDPGFADRVLSLLARGEADAVVLPYIDMLWAAHNWPAPLEFADDMKPVLVALERRGYVVLEKREHYALVRLVPRFQGVSRRGELERQLFFETCISPYPVSVQEESCALDYVTGSGWHDLDRAHDHVWSNKKATLRLPVPADCKAGECSVVLTLSVYGASKSRPVNVIFQVDAQDVKAPAPLVISGREQQQVTVPLSVARPTQVLSIQVPEAVSPKELQGASDPRVLGVALYMIKLVRLVPL